MLQNINDQLTFVVFFLKCHVRSERRRLWLFTDSFSWLSVNFLGKDNLVVSRYLSSGWKFRVSLLLNCFLSKARQSSLLCYLTHSWGMETRFRFLQAHSCEHILEFEPGFEIIQKIVQGFPNEVITPTNYSNLYNQFFVEQCFLRYILYCFSRVYWILSLAHTHRVKYTHTVPVLKVKVFCNSQI